MDCQPLVFYTAARLHQEIVRSRIETDHSFDQRAHANHIHSRARARNEGYLTAQNQYDLDILKYHLSQIKHQ